MFISKTQHFRIELAGSNVKKRRSAIRDRNIRPIVRSSTLTHIARSPANTYLNWRQYSKRVLRAAVYVSGFSSSATVVRSGCCIRYQRCPLSIHVTNLCLCAYICLRSLCEICVSTLLPTSQIAI